MKAAAAIVFVVLVLYMIFGGMFFLSLEKKKDVTRTDKVIGYGAMIAILSFPIWFYILFLIIL